MTNGEETGTDGQDWAVFWRAMAWVTLFISAVILVNIFTVLQDEPELSVRAAVGSEVSSGLSGIALIWMPWFLVRLAPLDDRRWWRTLAVHGPALLLFSLLHVTGFILLRQWFWSLAGATYDFGPFLDRFPYELRKDALSYVGVTVGIWVARRLAFQAAATQPDHPATFDIRDGAKVIRVPIADILAVASAGNYVEVHLADGRKPLMRSSLSAVEARLAPFGFVRTHRSWLVSAARVTGLTPAGSGDYTVALGSLEAPLSRRFPAALMRLRGG